MSEKLAKSEIRHAKQKAKLESKGKVEPEITFTQEKNKKVEIMEAALDKGFDCSLNIDTVLMFNINEEEAVIKWLFDNYAEKENGTLRLPFSYGFGGHYDN